MAHREKEIYGQYAFDNISGQPVHDPYGTRNVRGTGDIAFHGKKSGFDQGYEEAVGTYRTSGGEISVVSETDLARTLGGSGLYFADYGNVEGDPDEDEGRKKKKKKDKAYDWLRDNDPTHPEYTGKGSQDA